MICRKCKKKTDEDNSFYTKNKKKAMCFKCMNKILKTAKCVLCEKKVKNTGFSNIICKNKEKFICIDCINLVKGLGK